MIEVRAETARDLMRVVAARLGQGVERAFRDAGAVHQREMARRFVPFGSRDPIQTRTGGLRRSFGYATRGSGLDRELRMFSQGTVYARAQEYGGTIRPKNKRYLTIPLPDALTSGGAQKGGKRLVQRGKRYLTADGRPTHVFRSRAGNLLIAERTRNDQRKLLYVLKPSVTLKPRLGFRETYTKTTLPFLRERLRKAAQEAVRP